MIPGFPDRIVDVKVPIPPCETMTLHFGNNLVCETLSTKKILPELAYSIKSASVNWFDCAVTLGNGAGVEVVVVVVVVLLPTVDVVVIVSVSGSVIAELSLVLESSMSRVNPAQPLRITPRFPRRLHVPMAARTNSAFAPPKVIEPQPK